MPVSRPDLIRLQGGPGDGQEHPDPGTDVLEWVPTTEHEKIETRMHGRSLTMRDRIEYCRSRRTKTIFVYQP